MLIASLPTFIYVLIYIFLLLFNKHQFYYLFDIYLHIYNYFKGQNHVNLYIDVVCQITQIFDMGTAFALGLVNAIKKNKSFEMES